jgi:hypothetical protein
MSKGTISSEADHAQGAWGGKGVKKRKTNPKFLKTTAGIEASERKDAGKNNVIITEKKDKKARQFQVKDLPYPYTSIAQYEARFNNPLGAEWNSRSIHQKETMPRVTKKVSTLSWQWVLVLIQILSEAQSSSPSEDCSRPEVGRRTWTSHPRGIQGMALKTHGLMHWYVLRGDYLHGPPKRSSRVLLIDTIHAELNSKNHLAIGQPIVLCQCLVEVESGLRRCWLICGETFGPMEQRVQLSHFQLSQDKKGDPLDPDEARSDSICASRTF